MKTETVINRNCASQFAMNVRRSVSLMYFDMDAKLAAEAQKIRDNAAAQGVEIEAGSLSADYIAEIESEREKLAAMYDGIKSVVKL